MYHRLKRYLEHFKILCPLLFGFREKSSTMYALIVSKTESICESIDNNEFGCGIFIDWKKGLDTVYYAFLITKLNYHGIIHNVNEWFKSYLSHREQ